MQRGRESFVEEGKRANVYFLVSVWEASISDRHDAPEARLPAQLKAALPRHLHDSRRGLDVGEELGSDSTPTALC